MLEPLSCCVDPNRAGLEVDKLRIKTISSHLAQHGTLLPVGAVAQPAPTLMAAMPFLQVRSDGSECADAPGLPPIESSPGHPTADQAPKATCRCPH